MRTMSHPELLSVSRGWVVWVGGKLRRSPPIQPSLHNPTSRVGKAGRATKDKKLINWAAIPVNEWIIQIYLRDEFQFEEEYCSKIFCALNIHQLQDQQPILLKTCSGEYTQGVCLQQKIQSCSPSHQFRRKTGNFVFQICEFGSQVELANNWLSWLKQENSC